MIIMNDSTKRNQKKNNVIFTTHASHLSFPPQFHPTAPSHSPFSKQFPSVRHDNSLLPTARSTALDGDVDDVTPNVTVVMNDKD